MADTKKIIISVDVKETGSEKVSSSANKAAIDLSKLTEAEKIQRIEAEKLKIKNAELAESFRQQAYSQLQAANAGKPLRAQSGLNNAILLETSRLASDASYGFQGMANNLGQLVSLFFSFTKTAGGVVESLKQLGKSLLGTGGVLIAIQLLIAFGDDIYNFFFGASKAAEEFKKKLDDLTKSITEQIQLFQTLTSTIFDYNLNGNALADTASLLQNRFSKFNNGMKKLEEEGLSNNEESVKNLVSSFGRLLEVEKELVIVGEQYKNSLEEDGDETERSIKLRGQFKKLIRELIELEKLFTIETKKGTSKRQAAFQKGIFDQSKLEERYRQDAIDKSTLTEEQKIELQRDFAKEELKIALDTFIEKERERLRVFKERNKENKAAILDAEKKFNQSVNEAYQEADDVRRQIDNAYDLDHKDLLVKRAMFYQEHYDKVTEIQRIELQKREEQEADFIAKINKITGFEGIARATSEIDSIRGQMDLEQIRFDNKIENLEREAEIARANGLMTIDIEQKIQNERERFANQNIELKIKERQALINITNQLGQAIIANLEEGSNAQKAASIALATINTYEAATAALGMKPYTPANIAQAAAVVLAGLAQVRNIVNTKLPNEKGGGINVEAPDFNIVGASPESQLAQTVAGQQQKPLKAFVVGKEITYHQELERNILTTAGLGD